MGKAILFPNFAGIPEHIQRYDRWLNWAEIEVEGRLTKVPFRAGDLSRHASTSDRSTWSTYVRAKNFYLGHKDELSGVGWCRDENIALLDGDGFFRPLGPTDTLQGYEFEKYGRTFAEWDWDGKQPEEIYNLLLSADAWMELSPSSFGLRGAVSSSSICASFDAHVPNTDHTGFALYTGHRYGTVTGATLWPGSFTSDRSTLVESMHLWFPKSNGHKAKATPGAGPRAYTPPTDAGAAGAADMSDDAVLARLMKSRKGRILFEGGDPGDLGDNSHSGLDFALCLALAFWTRKDPGQMDRLFRQSALYCDREEKWERVGEDTIARAIAIQTEVWEPPMRRGRSSSAAEFAQAAKKRKVSGKETAPSAEEKRQNSGREAAPDGAEESGGSSGEPPPPPDGDEAMPPPPDGSWKGLLLISRGKPAPCLANADIALRLSPQWKDSIVLDEFSNVIRTVKNRQPPTPLGEIESWTDTADTNAAIWLQKQGVPVSSGMVHEAVLAIAQEHRVHPLRDWLKTLVWDGEPRIDRWLITYLGVEENTYTALVGAWWLGQAVARAFHPGTQADYCLVLEGPQGQKKSQALRVLAGDVWFTDQIADFANKDSSMDLQGKWVIELGEFDRMAHKPSVVKAFLTRMEDHFRPPYGRFTLNFPRQCVFAATVNLDEYFSDDTGNRRFWPVRCGVIDLDALARDREQLWAEAVERFSSNKARRWPATPEETSSFAAEQAEREELDVWHDDIAAWIEDPRQAFGEDHHPLGDLRSEKGKVTVADILTHALLVEPKHQNPGMKTRVAKTLRRLGWKCRKEGPVHARYRAYFPEKATP